VAKLMITTTAVFTLWVTPSLAQPCEVHVLRAVDDETLVLVHREVSDAIDRGCTVTVDPFFAHAPVLKPGYPSAPGRGSSRLDDLERRVQQLEASQ
jgi:hypothetical protein